MQITLLKKPGVEPDLEVYFNPRYFSDAEAIDLIQASDERSTINAQQLKQKGLESALILTLKFVSLSALAGFFGKVGSDAYDSLKNKILKLSDRKSNDGSSVNLQLHIPKDINPLGCEIILDLPAEKVSLTNNSNLDFDMAVAVVKRLPYSNELQKVVLTSDPENTWKVVFYIKSDGQVVKI